MVTIKNIEFNLDDLDFSNLDGLDFSNMQEKSVTEKHDEKVYKKMMKFTDKHYKQAKCVKGILNIKLPEKDQEWFFVSQNKFNQFAFTLAVLELAGKIEELYISSYNIKTDLLESIKHLLNTDKIGYCKIIITYSIQARTPKIYSRLIELAKEQKNVDVILCDNHTKLSCIKTKEHYYVVSGSGNFTATNTKMEQYQFINSKELYEFYVNWFNEQETKQEYLKS